MVETATEEQKKEKEKCRPAISLLKFFDPWGPWVLVPNGSFMGYFDWVPHKFRIGPWSMPARIYMVALCVTIWRTKPQHFEFEPTFPRPYSFSWYYNLITFAWMTIVLNLTLCGRAGLFVLSTYTIQSWTVLTIRHGLTALAPFLSNDKHILLQINELLRFQGIVTATVTFVIWNFVIAPVILYKFMDCPKKRRDFVSWMFSFRLVQVHGFNIVFAILNTIATGPRHFTFIDLWCAFIMALLYSLFYLLILDRLGIHLYPIFSPRSYVSLVTWTIVFACYYGSFLLWNHVIERKWIHFEHFDGN